jgi:hypothetical protein
LLSFHLLKVYWYRFHSPQLPPVSYIHSRCSEQRNLEIGTKFKSSYC